MGVSTTNAIVQGDFIRFQSDLAAGNVPTASLQADLSTMSADITNDTDILSPAVTASMLSLVNTMNAAVADGPSNNAAITAAVSAFAEEFALSTTPAPAASTPAPANTWSSITASTQSTVDSQESAISTQSYPEAPVSYLTQLEASGLAGKGGVTESFLSQIAADVKSGNQTAFSADMTEMQIYDPNALTDGAAADMQGIADNWDAEVQKAGRTVSS